MVVYGQKGSETSTGISASRGRNKGGIQRWTITNLVSRIKPIYGGIVGFIVFALIYTPLVWLPIIKNRLQTGVGNSTLFWIVNCIGVIPFIAVYGLIKAMFKKWRKEKGSK